MERRQGIALGQFLADNPTVQVYDAKARALRSDQAAELGEPGAMSALIALKLSSNAQFADKAGGCRLAERAVKDGDESAKKFLTALHRELTAAYPFLPSARIVGRPMPVASKPPSTDSSCPVM